MASSGGVSEAPSVPTVFFDSLEPGLGYANVAQANKDGIDVLVGHLADFHGYRRIAYLGAPPALTSGIERLEGYRDAMGRRALPVPPELIVLSDGTWSPESGTAAMRDLLELTEPPEAVVAASDTLALGAIQAARDHGLRVPDDLAIVSFDDPFFGAFIEPQLTALMRDESELGRVAAGSCWTPCATVLSGGRSKYAFRWSSRSAAPAAALRRTPPVSLHSPDQRRRRRCGGR